MTSKVSTAYHGLLWVQHCEKYRRRWLSDETIVREINKAYPNIVDGGISRRDLNLCASPRGYGKFKGGIADLYIKSNNTGIFIAIASMTREKEKEYVVLLHWSDW